MIKGWLSALYYVLKNDIINVKKEKKCL